MKRSQYALHPSVEMGEPLERLLATRRDLRFTAVNSEIPHKAAPGSTWLYADLAPFPYPHDDTRMWWTTTMDVGTGVARILPIPVPQECVSGSLARLGIPSARFRVEPCEATHYHPWNPPAEIVAARRERTRHVYFIQPVDGGLIKIGVAVDPASRLKLLQIGCPVALRILGTLPGGQPLETELHARFATQRVRGEWFEPTAELLSLIPGGRA